MENTYDSHADLLKPNVEDPKNVALLGWGYVHIINFGKPCAALFI